MSELRISYSSTDSVRLAAFDIDGSLTDGVLHIGRDGELFKSFSVRDGLALAQTLPRFGVQVAFLTARRSQIVALRADELGVRHVLQGVADKLSALNELAKSLDLTLDQVAYFGDDDNDLDAMAASGFRGCPADASDSVKKLAHFISQNPGGKGAAREFVDRLLQDGYLHSGDPKHV